MVVYKKIVKDTEMAKTDYGVAGAFSSEDEAEAYINKNKDNANMEYSIAKF